MALQTLYQGAYLLKCLLTPQDAAIQQNHEKSKQQLADIICLNISFILHCLCIFIVSHICTTEPKIILEMMTGEVVYRVFAIVMFYKMLKQVDGVDQVSRDSEPQLHASPVDERKAKLDKLAMVPEEATDQDNSPEMVCPGPKSC